MFANTCVLYGAGGAETATDSRRGTAVAPRGSEIDPHPRTGAHVRAVFAQSWNGASPLRTRFDVHLSGQILREHDLGDRLPKPLVVNPGPARGSTRTLAAPRTPQKPSGFGSCADSLRARHDMVVLLGMGCLLPGSIPLFVLPDADAKPPARPARTFNAVLCHGAFHDLPFLLSDPSCLLRLKWQARGAGNRVSTVTWRAA